LLRGKIEPDKDHLGGMAGGGEGATNDPLKAEPWEGDFRKRDVRGSFERIG